MAEQILEGTKNVLISILKNFSKIVLISWTLHEQNVFFYSKVAKNNKYLNSERYFRL
jgi:hypothetical protein